MLTDFRNSHTDIYLAYGYLMYPVSLKVTNSITIDGETFHSKEGYHVSLLRLTDMTQAEQDTILEFAKSFPIKLVQITQQYRLAQEGDRRSIIVRVHMEGLTEMIATLNTHHGYSFDYPPTHITLFVLPTMEGGIGINTSREYTQFTRPISQADSLKISRSFALID